jgi:hypothetical protein
MKKKEKEKTEILNTLITTSRNPSHFLRRTSNILAYSLPNSQRMNSAEDIQVVGLIIELSEIIALKRHDKKTRIVVEQLKLNFSKSIEMKLKDNVIKIFNPFIHSSSTESPRYSLSIDFSQESPCEIIGNAIQHSFSSNLHIYTLHISSCGINGQ